MKFNILHLTPDFNYSDGRSYYVYLLMKYLSRNGHKVFLATNGGDSFERIEELDIPCFNSDSLSKKSSFLKSLKFVSGIVERHDIDIIHSHHRYYELLANNVRKEKNVRTVFTALSLVDKRFFVEYKSDRIIAVSNVVKEMLINRFKVDEKKIISIPNFADSEETDADPGIKFKSSKEVNLLAAGRFHKDKDFITLLKAMTLIRDHKLKLTLIGEGEERRIYEKFIRVNSLKAEILPPQRSLKKFFDKAGICILTSVRDPLPGFMLQSGLHGKPFIGSDVDGISEVIVNGENGLLFRKKDTAGLSEKIRTFIEEPERARKCGVQLQRVITKGYTEKSAIPQIEKLYVNLFKTI